MFQSISHEPERVTGSHLVRLVGKDQAVILSSPSPIFVLYNSAWGNPITSANLQHLDLLPVLPGTLPLPLDPPPSPFPFWIVLMLLKQAVENMLLLLPNSRHPWQRAETKRRSVHGGIALGVKVDPRKFDRDVPTKMAVSIREEYGMLYTDRYK